MDVLRIAEVHFVSENKPFPIMYFREATQFSDGIGFVVTVRAG